MSAIAIRAEGVAKRYAINTDVAADTLRDRLAATARRLRRGPARRAAAPPRELWALDDVSFEVARGDVVGVVGRNGAGKSTLLKVLSRITPPTRGRITIHGRVASLLEVGTGFHPELSGRENIVLSGAILGMPKAEIDRKFDEIVAFAETARFIDTPVKHYSSGMYLKLAFAVAAHLDPDVLLIDEVLAVGDHAFQQKCLGKMGEVSRAGRTVLFVSHNMSAVAELCRRGLLVRAGRVEQCATAAEAVARYLYDADDAADLAARGRGPVAFGRVRVAGDAAGDTPGSARVASGRPFEVEVDVALREAGNVIFFLIVADAAGTQVVHARLEARDLGIDAAEGPIRLRLGLPALWLATGLYSLHVKAITQTGLDTAHRFTSERVLLHVHGAMDASGRTVLAPRVACEVAPLAPATAGATHG